jgi:hypothetical protein
MGILDSSVTTDTTSIIVSHGYYWHNRVANWQLKFAWLPHRCSLSGRFIWLKFAYCGRKIISGPGEPVIEDYWHTTTEHMIWLLKR